MYLKTYHCYRPFNYNLHGCFAYFKNKALTFNPDEYMYVQVKTEIILTPARLLSCHSWSARCLGAKLRRICDHVADKIKAVRRSSIMGCKRTPNQRSIWKSLLEPNNTTYNLYPTPPSRASLLLFLGQK
jgi:hypothetical protein